MFEIKTSESSKKKDSMGKLKEKNDYTVCLHNDAYICLSYTKFIFLHLQEAWETELLSPQNSMQILFPEFKNGIWRATFATVGS